MNEDQLKAIDKQIGENIRALREKRQLTEQQLGEKIGVRPQRIHKWELGEHRLTGARIHQLCHALGVPQTKLFEGAVPRVPLLQPNVPEELASIKDPLTQRDLFNIVRAYEAIDPEGRRRLSQLIEELKLTHPAATR